MKCISQLSEYIYIYFFFPVLLHEMMTVLDEPVKVAVVALCELWWLHDLDTRDFMMYNTLVYLVEASIRKGAQVNLWPLLSLLAIGDGVFILAQSLNIYILLFSMSSNFTTDNVSSSLPVVQVIKGIDTPFHYLLLGNYRGLWLRAWQEHLAEYKLRDHIIKPRNWKRANIVPIFNVAR